MADPNFVGTEDASTFKSAPGMSSGITRRHELEAERKTGDADRRAQAAQERQ